MLGLFLMDWMMTTSFGFIGCVDSFIIQSSGNALMKMIAECSGKVGLRCESSEFSPVLKPKNASTGSAQE